MLAEHLGYVADTIRLQQFRAAIAQAVTPGAVVVDLGCGTGVLGLMCLQAGASRVVAIDSTQMIEVARETYQRAGMADRCEFIRNRSFRVDLRVGADVVICDHVGFFGFDYGIVDLLADARKRFLRPQGTILPSRIKLFAGAVESEEARNKADGWRSGQVPPEFHWLGSHGVNTAHPVKLRKSDFLSSAYELGIIDLRIDNPDFLSWKSELAVERDGILHGLTGWFECELAESVWMTNSPLSDSAIDRSQVFFPIGEPVRVETGERIQATVMGRPAEKLMAWVVELPRSGRRFSHSTWQGDVLGTADFMRKNPQRVPRSSHFGEARAIVLRYCDGRRTTREIEEVVLREQPGLFPSSAEISRFVAEVLASDAAPD
jgi:hypothetical protein